MSSGTLREFVAAILIGAMAVFIAADFGYVALLLVGHIINP